MTGVVNQDNVIGMKRNIVVMIPDLVVREREHVRNMNIVNQDSPVR